MYNQQRKYKFLNVMQSCENLLIISSKLTKKLKVYKKLSMRLILRNLTMPDIDCEA